MPRRSAGLLAGRNRYATEQLQAAAVIGPDRTGDGAAGAGRAGGRRASRGRRRPDAAIRFRPPTSRPSQRLDLPIAPSVDRLGRVFRVPVQPRAGRSTTELKRQGRRAGAAAVVPSRRREADVQPRRGLRSRPHPAHAQRRRDRRGQRSGARRTPTWRSGRTTITSATPKARSVDVDGRRRSRRRCRASSSRAPKTIASGTAPTMTGRGRWR